MHYYLQRNTTLYHIHTFLSAETHNTISHPYIIICRSTHHRASIHYDHYITSIHFYLQKHTTLCIIIYRETQHYITSIHYYLQKHTTHNNILRCKHTRKLRFRVHNNVVYNIHSTLQTFPKSMSDAYYIRIIEKHENGHATLYCTYVYACIYVHE